ncbi:MAG: GatB/YqeY domain-containing protein, partial [Hyphomicrobiaceae bacterium]
RRDSIEQYNAGKRSDLAAKEAAEIAIIEAYLPSKLGESETRDLVAGLIAETGAAGHKDMGKVKAALKARITGQIDMGRASAFVKELLAKA